MDLVESFDSLYFEDKKSFKQRRSDLCEATSGASKEIHFPSLEGVGELSESAWNW
jgi:hypothetical protein